MYWRLIVGGYTLHFLKANPDQLVIPVPAYLARYACRCHRIARRRRSALVGRKSSESESSRVSFRRTYVYLRRYMYSTVDPPTADPPMPPPMPPIHQRCPSDHPIRARSTTTERAPCHHCHNASRLDNNDNGRQKARRRQQKQPTPRPRCWHPKQRESSAAIVPHSPAHLGRISPPFWREELPRQK